VAHTPKTAPPGSTGPRAEERSADVGDVLGNHALVKMLGEGTMGRVFLARHVLMGRLAAIKVLKADPLERPELIGRFFQEARAVNQINHRNIIQVFDFAQEEGPRGKPVVYCVMELLEGQTLGAAIEGRALILARIGDVVGQVCDALAAAHAVGVFHRDLKPDNVFLTAKSGGADDVKVLDFGVAKLTASAQELAVVETIDGAVIGTPAFMSPEQLSSEPVDARSDVYSVGVTLYEALSGSLPFDAPNFAHLATQILKSPPRPLPSATPAGEPIPPALAALVLRALSKDPAQRPQSMAALKAELGAALAAPTAAPAPPPRRRAGGPVALSVGALVAVGAAGFLLTRPAAKSAPPALVSPSLPAPPAPMARERPVGAPAEEHAWPHEEHAAPGPAPAPANAPAPEPPRPASRERAPAPLGTKDIAAVISRGNARLLGCIQAHSASLEQPEGQVNLALAIDEAGVVTEAKVANPGLSGTPLGDCVVAEALKLKFPRHPGPAKRVVVPLAWKAHD
jgi:Protein kinase domain